MKFSADIGTFGDALSLANKASDKSVPILSSALITAKEGFVRVVCTDTNMEITTSFAAEISEPGDACISSKFLSDILKKLPAGKVSFSLELGHGKLVSGKSRYALTAGDPRSFPLMGDSISVGTISMDGNDLAAVLKRVLPAVGVDDSRHYLAGIFMRANQDEGSVEFAATNGHRLFMVKVGAKNALMPEIIVPSFAIREIVRLVDGAGAVVLQATTDRIQVTVGRTTIKSKLIYGTYPNIDGVTPKGGNSVAYFECGMLDQCCNRVSAIADDMNRGIKLGLNGDVMTVEVSNQQMGKATDEAPMDYDAAPLDVGFNLAYFREALTALGDGTVRMAITDPGAPVLLTNEEDPSIKVVLMPMRA